MRTLFLLATLGSALALAGCGGKDADTAGNAASPGAPVAAVAAPAGTRWSETVTETPAGGFLRGNPNAPVKLIEYASFTCPHCAEFAKEGDEPLAKAVDTGKVSFEFRNFIRDPLDITMALIARCGGKDPFFPLTHELFANQEAMFNQVQAKGEPAYQAAMAAPPAQRFTKVAELGGLIDFAKQRGIPDGQARTCLADMAKAEALAKHNEAAVKEFDVQGTPTIIMNGTKLDNVATWPALEAKLREAGV
jgi:protein-disulfide isomerase